ncbi:substrate-binding domain-containing protein [Variovorax sp.]|uniref:substrate-binding domain-containing protein n=1 Tax=Variovorax sp. TaxID=1871043 RepID=UPI002D35E4E9|nr:substrate-binding domain-containing protein [Variovorax sp.]HYP83379.1 substrate-binding domain-containing protein [Variovorax sp.]
MNIALRGISSMATRALLDALSRLYADTRGVQVRVESVGGVDAARRIAAGEPFDFAVLAADAIDKLAAAGHLEAAGRVPLARSDVAVAVPAGARQPDIGSADAVRRAVLAAPAIGYSTGPSGVALLALFQRWGIAGQVRDRLVQAPPGVPVGALLADGRVALGFQQTSELQDLPGIDLLGPLPEDIRITTTFTAAPCRGTAQADAVRELLDWFASPACDDIRSRSGMAAAREERQEPPQ